MVRFDPKLDREMEHEEEPWGKKKKKNQQQNIEKRILMVIDTILTLSYFQY